MSKRSVAVIGSFKQHNASVQKVCADLRASGVTVKSPKGIDIVQKGIDFVRFHSDPADWPDSAVQSLALHRIFAADLVYVVAPTGYVGKTTCYEIGRVVQRGQPIYFSAQPVDLPLRVPPMFILDHAALVHLLNDSSWLPTLLYEHENDRIAELERDLIQEVLRNE